MAKMTGQDTRFVDHLFRQVQLATAYWNGTGSDILSSMTIGAEHPADYIDISKVNYPSFGQDVEAKLVNALRDGGQVRRSTRGRATWGQDVDHSILSSLSATQRRIRGGK
ncbi:MAG: hypothetical protein NTU53_22970 [Planctomycetota bacterium]|nr:hypothetical protein [Planctomycetota bacterium]